MDPGDDFIASNRLYGGSITQFGKTFKKFDWRCSFVDVDRAENVREALTPKTKAGAARHAAAVKVPPDSSEEDVSIGSVVPIRLHPCDGYC